MFDRKKLLDDKMQNKEETKHCNDDQVHTKYSEAQTQTEEKVKQSNSEAQTEVDSKLLNLTTKNGKQT